MSVRTLSLVFEYDMPELKTDDGKTVPDSTAKFVLLALADHASDEGEGAYPGVKRICKKTSMSSQTVCNALNALRHNEYITKTGKSKLDTNDYTINLEKLQPLEFQPVESSNSNGKNRKVGKKILPARVKPFNPPAQPSVKEGASAKPAKPKATDIPELVVYREVVSHWPKPFQRDIVINSIQKVGARLGRDVTAADLAPFFTAWGEVSGNDWSLKWLTEWAVAGRVNGNGNGHHPAEPKAYNGIREFLAGVDNG